MTQKELMERGLPKWPQMIVTGAKLPRETALEIIRRTDDFFKYPSGNDHLFVDKAVEMLHMPINCDEYEEMLDWQRKWGLIQTEYVDNSWVSCSFVGGPHGWCNPDGTIAFVNNVGKWPTVEEIYNDWSTLASNFPFIEVEATLMNGEEGEEDIKPVVSFLIRSGEVTLVDPAERNLHEEFHRTIKESEDHFETLKRMVVSGPALVEHALSLEQIEDWAADFLKKYPEYREEGAVS